MTLEGWSVRWLSSRPSPTPRVVVTIRTTAALAAGASGNGYVCRIGVVVGEPLPGLVVRDDSIYGVYPSALRNTDVVDREQTRNAVGRVLCGHCELEIGERGHDRGPAGDAAGVLAAPHGVIPIPAPHQAADRQPSEELIEGPPGLLARGAFSPRHGPAGAPREDAAAPVQAQSEGGRARWVRVRQGLKWCAGVHARPMPAGSHLCGGDVRFETWQGHVGSHFGQQPHLALLGKEQLQMITAPAARQTPRPYPHLLILPRSTGNPTPTGNARPRRHLRALRAPFIRLMIHAEVVCHMRKRS